MSGPIYLDNNATTRPLPQVIAAVTAAMQERYGNPSSPNSRGNIAKAVLVEARQEVAELLGADEGDVIFTAGGTEANNLALQSFWQQYGAAGRIITTPVEHSSILAPARQLEQLGCALEILPVDQRGLVQLQDLTSLLDAAPDRPTLAAIQWANSETGVIQPIEQIGSACHDRGALLLVDAAQAVGRMPIEMESLPIDFLSFTAHKFHGPPGVGALCCADRSLLRPLLRGGDQQHGLRAGTENLPGLAGLAAAARLRRKGMRQAVRKLAQLRDAFEEEVLRSGEVTVNGDPQHRVPNTTSLRFGGINALALLARLDASGVSCSMVSACTSSRPEPSYVLLALGLSEEEAYASIRFSFAVDNTIAQARRAAELVASNYAALLERKQLKVAAR